MTIFCNMTDYETLEDVREAYAEAAEIVEVCGGWMVFDSADDYETWIEQE